MTTDELRKAYIDFFKSKNHRTFPSDSLIPAGDPSLLFTGAGMNQFKPYFLGLKKDVKRAVSCQKCLRTADLDRVGQTAYHHTFFEMLGNFSFGDYFKEEAIAWGWEFVTQVLKLPEKRLWVSVYEEDDDAFQIWKKKIGLPESRIRRMDAVDNFWPSNAKVDGPNGPCGPCSEIYVGETPGKGVEIWNLVFTQYDRQNGGALVDLPQKNIDTGMGLERTASVLQGVETNFDIDSFKKIREELKRLLKSGAAETAHENAVMDHLRAVVFSIADGALPSNEGRGYVIRKLIRLGTEHFLKTGAATSGTLHKLVPAIVAVMGNAYPEIKGQEKMISRVIENEELSYLEILNTQVPRLVSQFEKAKSSSLPASIWIRTIAFPYYDALGVPLDVIEESSRRAGLDFDKALFHKLLEEQKKRSRESSKITAEIFSKNNLYALVEGLPPTEFLGYDATEAENCKLLKIIKGQNSVEKLEKGEEGLLIFDKSPFYAEAGGQVGDTGRVQGKNFFAEVLDAQWLEKCIAHQVLVKEGAAAPNQIYKLTVAPQRRADIMKNHTATHLLHSALRKILGEHVKQSGSLVAEDALRFDFTHFKAVGPEALAKVEALVNTEIQKNVPLNKKVVSKDEAMKEGAVAPFGEKYGEEVRVVTIGDFSKELCGGTHLRSTGEIGLFKIVSESSIQAGVRRIEALTGMAAARFWESNQEELAKIRQEFQVDNSDFKAEFERVQKKLKGLESRLFHRMDLKMKQETKEKFEKAPEINGIKRFCMTTSLADMELIKNDIQFLKSQNKSFIALFRADSFDKFSYIVAASGDVVSGGWDSSQIVQMLNHKLEGHGGGRPDFAVGGSKSLGLKDKVFDIFQAGTETLLRSIGGRS